MPIIHLVGGDKGGIGKTTFSWCLAHCFDKLNIDYQLIDADPNNPDVAQIYGGLTDIHFKASDEVSAINSKTAAKVDRIFELAINSPVLVNLPANVHDSVAYWILDNSLLDEGDLLKGVTLYQWFLTDGSLNSLQLFIKSLETYKGKLPHILVCNRWFTQEWDDVFETEDYKNAQAKYNNFKNIFLPALRVTEREHIKSNRFSFSMALEDASLPTLSRSRLHRFLKNVESEILSTGLIQSNNNQGKVA